MSFTSNYWTIMVIAAGTVALVAGMEQYKVISGEVRARYNWKMFRFISVVSAAVFYVMLWAESWQGIAFVLSEGTSWKVGSAESLIGTFFTISLAAIALGCVLYVFSFALGRLSYDIAQEERAKALARAAREVAEASDEAEDDIEA